MCIVVIAHNLLRHFFFCEDEKAEAKEVATATELEAAIVNSSENFAMVLMLMMIIIMVMPTAAVQTNDNNKLHGINEA